MDFGKFQFLISKLSHQLILPAHQIGFLFTKKCLVPISSSHGFNILLRKFILPIKRGKGYFQTFFKHPSFLNFLIVCFKTDNRLKPFPSLVYSLISYQLPCCSTSFSCKRKKSKVTSPPPGSSFDSWGSGGWLLIPSEV